MICDGRRPRNPGCARGAAPPPVLPWPPARRVASAPRAAAALSRRPSPRAPPTPAGARPCPRPPAWRPRAPALRARTTATGPGSSATMPPVEGRELDLREQDGDQREDSADPLPATLAGGHERDQREGPHEELRREDLVADGEGEHAGECGEGDVLRRRAQEAAALPDHHVDAEQCRDSQPWCHGRDRGRARRGQELRAVRVAGADVAGAEAAREEERGAGDALDLQRPFGVIGHDGAQPVEIARETAGTGGRRARRRRPRP